MRIGEVLKKWRILSEMDVRTAAKQIGISPSTLMRIERGAVPPTGQTVITLLNWLLFTEAPNENGSGEAGGQVSGVGEAVGVEVAGTGEGE